jgi:hypothetical protein
LIDTSKVPPLFADHGVEVEIGSTIGTYELPEGLRSVIGRKR